ncbi:MAG TPA: S8 family serine peptidase [Steroidobacteraceae bacterium]|jgi:subtilisin family serine protease|nr:S8 family serine peptidase [Steroidobacteraceae bacterium]
MRTLAPLCALWLAVLSAPAAHATVPPATPQPPRIIVGFANAPHSLPRSAGATGSRYAGNGYRVSQNAHTQARSVAAHYALRQLASWPIEALGMHCVVYEITDGRAVPEVLALLSQDARVVLAQPLQEFHTLTDAPAAAAPYNDPLYDLQTNLVALGIARAHQRTQGAGVRIALIDTGVDGAHPDLSGRIARTSSFIAGGARAPSDLRHGTAMAGVIAAVANNHVGIVGIAPLARLEVFEACWQLSASSDEAACNTFTLAQALAGALAAGTPLVNLSLAGPADPLLTALVESGLKRGVVFVAAAAPEAGFPGSIPGVIRAAGSGQPLPAGTFAAPAVHVLTTRPNAQYDFESGTSVACAELTGVIALLMSAAHSHLTSDAIMTLLRTRDTVAADSAGEDTPPVDVNAALLRLDAARTPARAVTAR